MKTLCFGSLNIDYVYEVPHFVRGGETLASRSLHAYTGGKVVVTKKMIGERLGIC